MLLESSATLGCKTHVLVCQIRWARARLVNTRTEASSPSQAAPWVSKLLVLFHTVPCVSPSWVQAPRYPGGQRVVTAFPGFREQGCDNSQLCLPDLDFLSKTSLHPHLYPSHPPTPPSLPHITTYRPFLSCYLSLT